MTHATAPSTPWTVGAYDPPRARSLRSFWQTVQLRAWVLLHVPLIFLLSPALVELTEERVVLKLPLRRRSRNHAKAMYLGALCAGADCAGAVMAMNLIRKSTVQYSLLFTDFRAEFLKKAGSAVHFVCDDGQAISALVAKAGRARERQRLPVQVTAYCPETNGSDPVARFTLTLSLQRKSYGNR